MNRPSVLLIVFLLLAVVATPLSAQMPRYAAGDLIADPTGVMHTIVLVNAVSVLTADGLVILTNTDVGAVLPDPSDPTRTVTITSVQNNATTNRPEVLTFQELTSDGAVVRTGTVRVATDISESLASLGRNPGQGSPSSVAATGLATGESNVFRDIRTGGSGAGGRTGYSLKACFWFFGDQCTTVSVSPKAGDPGQAAPGIIDIVGPANGNVHTSSDGVPGIVIAGIGGGGGYGGSNLSGTVSVTTGAAGAIALGAGASGGPGAGAGSVGAQIFDSVTTEGTNAGAVTVRSAGGAGGIGGYNATGTIAASRSSAESFALGIGGFGGGGGAGGSVQATMTGDVATSGAGSTAVLIESAGGAGGIGGQNLAVGISLSQGAATASSIGIGGFGGTGGSSAGVTLVRSGVSQTSGASSDGVNVQSTAGGGGNAGSNVSAAISYSPTAASTADALGVGGLGGRGGASGSVDATITGDVKATGLGSDTLTQAGGVLQRLRTGGSNGVVAQSVGGGGGNGGSNVSAAIALGQLGSSMALGVGGFGGGGGNAGTVDLNVRTGIVSAIGDQRAAVVAQSVGGSGGSGGLDVAVGIGTANTAAIGVGGFGGNGGAGNSVTATVVSDLSAAGTASRGLIAQSVGGGGGNGSVNISAAIAGDGTTAALPLAAGLGGVGGGGNRSGNVSVTQAGQVVIEGRGAIGVVAQSLAGSGGTGGANISGNLTSRNGPTGVVGFGGWGGLAANAGDVRLVSDGTVIVDGRDGGRDGGLDGGRTNFGGTTNGILAQSVGGGGGNAGLNLSAVAFTGAASPIALSIGGSGAGGGSAGSVTVERGTNSAASIQTSGDRANGLTAQSVGGAGGVGGASVNLVIGETGGLAASGGGTGGAGGKGAGVVVENARGAIATRGANSTGLYAQSVGGNGGDGGIGVSGGLPIRSIAGASTGGPGGGGGGSGAVRVTNAGVIQTIGNGASGLVAQSLAGSGGNGGLSLATTGVVSPGGGVAPMLILGGSGGAGGNAGDVTVSNAGQIATAGANAHGIYAQSSGGSGGTAGLGLGVTGGTTTLTANITPLIAALGGTALDVGQISGALVGSVADLSQARLTGVAGAQVALAGSAGTGGDGGRIAIANTGSVSTSGASAHGIFVQSLGGAVNAPATLLATAPNSGRGGDITVAQSGNITTTGAGSNGVFVQTLGGYVNGQAPSGAGAGGNISVALSGSVQAMAGDATGVLLQSAGPGGAGNITLTLDRGGRIAGGTQATAVSMIGGRDNLFTNQGLVTSLAGASGLAVLGATGNDSVVNSKSGSLTGSIDLGTGKNALTNLSGGVIESGAVIGLGDGNLFTNAGTLSPGGSNTIQTTALTGNFAQTAAPTWNVDIGEPGVSDRLTVSGSAQLGNSSTEVNLHEIATPTQSGVYTLLSAASGVSTGHFALGSMYGAMPIGKTFELAQSDTALQLSLLPSTGAFVWNGTIDNNWTTAFQRGTSNWIRPAGTFVFGTPGDASDVIMPGTGSSTTLGADFTINSLSVTSSTTPGVNGSVVVGGNNTLTLAAHGGRGITLDPGAPNTTIAVPVILGSDQTWVNGSSSLLTVNGPSITGAGKNLTIDGGGNTLLGAAIQTGTGSLSKAGAGRLVLSGANTYGGATTVTAGTLQAAATNTFSVNSAATVGQGAVLDLNGFNQAIGSLAGAGDVTLGSGVLATGVNNTSTTFGGTMAGSGGLVKTGSGTFTLAGVNTYSGGTLVSGGTLQGSTTSLQGSIVNQAEVRFEQSGNGTFAGTISGGGSVTKTGGGTATFGANSYTGTTTVAGGTLRANSVGAFGNSSATTVAGGATLDLNGFNQALGSLSGAGLVTLGSAVMVTGGNDASTLFSGSISGSGGIAKTGAGTFTVTGPNSYFGGTLVDRGTLQGNSTGLQGSIVNNSAVVFDQASFGTYAGNMSGSGSLTKQNSGLLALGGTNSYSGGTLVSGGTLQGNTSSLQGDILNNASVVFDQAFAGQYNGRMSGTGSLTKQNEGLLVLNGSHTYSGPTTVAGGELFVSGSIGAGSVRVLSGAALGGTGLVPAVTVEAGGVLAPGGLPSPLTVNGAAHLEAGSIAEAGSILTPALVGTLTVNGDVRLDPGAIYRVTAGRAAASLTQATGAVTLAGATIDVQGASSERFHPITTFTIFRGQNGVTGAVSKPLTSVSFLNPSLQLDSSGVTLTLRRNDVDFRSAGTSGNQTAVALSLNALVATATGPMADVINNVYDLSDQQALRAMGSMTGVAYQHVARSTFAGTETFMNTTMTRLAQVASGSGETVLGTGAGQSLMKTSGVWLSALGGSTRYSGNSADPGASIPSKGLVVGYDAAVGSDFILGVSGSESSPEVQLDDASSLTDSRLLHVGFYGNYNHSNSRLGVMVGLGDWNNNTTRDVTDGVTFSKAKAEYGGYGIFSHIEYGRLFAAGKSVIIEPQVGLQLTRVSLDGFTEDGAGVLNLVVPDRQMVSRRTRLGVRATSTLPFGSAFHLMVEGRATWAHELSPLDSVTVRFADDTATGGFHLEAPELGRNSALVGASLVGSTSRRFQFFASVGSEINHSITGWTGDAGVRAGW